MIQTPEPSEVFEQTMQWLRDHYAEFRFFTERDLVWTVQRHLTDVIEHSGLPFRVFNDYPMLPGSHRSRSADLVLVSAPVTPPTLSAKGKWSASAPVALAVEFKYEPAHARDDIWRTKLPVVGWDGIQHDIKRLHEFVEYERASDAYAIFVDEGGAFRRRPPIPPGAWRDWGNGAAVHWAKVIAAPAAPDKA